MASTLLTTTPSTSPNTLPLLQTIGIILTGSIGAANYAFSNISIPALLERAPSSSTVARVWLSTYQRGKARALTATAISTLAWSAAIYHTLHSEAPSVRAKLPYLAVALAGTVGIMPWTVITMESGTNARLKGAVERADRLGSEKFDEDKEVDRQVREEARFWDGMNNVRAAISGVGALAGILSLW